MLLKYSPKTSHVKMVVCANVEGFNPERKMIQLLPGTNEVTNDEWNCIKPTLSSELDNGEIIILAQKVSDGRGKPGGRKARDLVQMPVNIAVKYVTECLNPETLKKWYTEETREEVRVYITKRMNKLGVELPEDEIPEAPNASPMTLEEDENDDSDEDYENLESVEEDENDDSDEDYESMTKAELVEKAKEKGIKGSETLNKKEIIDALKA